MKRLAWPLSLGLLLALAVGVMFSRAEPTSPLRTLHSGHHFLPPYSNPRDRFGFDSDRSDPLTGYDIAQLNAGWYTDWGASLDPAHPDGLTYVQLIRFHAGADPHDPAQVTVSPSRETIAQIAAAHPGSLWLMSNEPDSLYQGDPIYPDVYAHVYHDFYTYIKGVDPTALIANGGIVQPTPCRMEYLDIVWDAYQEAYGKPMPVDVWNIHAFVLREVYGDWGASTPPGVDPSCGIDYEIRDGDNVDIFRENLIAFRQWMKDKGEQNKPLLISEYGVLWPEWLQDEDGHGFPPARVSQFMTQTFDLFLYETYSNVGYPEDDYRLVQAWAWYSLSDDQYYNGYLFYSDSKEISPIGETYADYTAALTDTQFTDLTVHHIAALDTFPLQSLAPGFPYETTSATLPISIPIANIGKLPASHVPVVAQMGPDLFTNTITLPTRYTADVASFPVASIVLTQPAEYDLELDVPVSADPDHTVGDPRTWNNTVTATLAVTVDARPDLVIASMDGAVHSTGLLSATLSITLTVADEGSWPAPPVSGTLRLSSTMGDQPLADRRFSIPAIGSSAQVTVMEELALPASDGDFYRLALEVDSDGVLDEQDEDNNRVEMTIPIVVTTTLQPDATSVLTSASGHLTFLFPAGTVTAPTEVHFRSCLKSELPPGPPLGITAFALTAYRDGQPISLTPLLPITVTWQYKDADVAGVDEDALNLYRLTEEDHWQRMFCTTEQRQPEANRLSTCTQQLGEYLFGQGYEHYLPLVLSSCVETVSEIQSPEPGVVLPRVPLRLPPWAIPSAWR